MSVINSAFQRYDEFRQDFDKQLSRYRGWMLITAEEEAAFFTTEGRQLLMQKGFEIIEWSYLSGDSDDRGDYAIRKTR